MIRRAVALRTALASVGVLLALLGAPGTALADPAGPTDYESEVVGLDPERATIDVEIVGGDAFVLLDVQRGTEVTVLGYRGEPYLWFDADGGVWENVRSPATYENTERYGVGELPPEADHTAAPEWRRVAGDGRWAWHDHRAHRMEPFPPVNVARGEPVLDAVVPLVVDGTDVDVRVTSTWMPAPSRLPVALGALAGAAVVALFRRRVAVATASVAAGALTIGAVQFASLPAATKPLWLWWVAPAVAFVAAVVALAVRSRSPIWAHGAALVAAVQLLVWSLERRHGLVRAVLPTDAPFWLDRFVTAAALATGALATVLVAVAVFRELSRPSPGRSPLPARRRPSAPSGSPR